MPFDPGVRSFVVPLLVSLLALGTPGCAALLLPGLTRAYVPFEAESHATRDELFAAAQRVASQLPHARIRVSAETFSVTALFSQSDSLRERTRITVLADGTVRVSVRTEMRDGSSRWQHTDGVCDGYTWSRERRLAAAVLETARLEGDAQGSAPQVSLAPTDE